MPTIPRPRTVLAVLAVSAGCAGPVSTAAVDDVAPDATAAVEQSVPSTVPTSSPVPSDTVASTTTTTTAVPGLRIVPVGDQSGPDTAVAQQRLLDLGFWVSATTGEYGVTTSQAVMAFEKYYGLAADGFLDAETAAMMGSELERPTGRSNTGDLIEVDKSKQLAFVVRDGETVWVINVSTGSEIPYREPDQNSPGRWIEDESVTRTGLFAVDRERPDGWWEGDLGEIYRPKYFDGGIAFHGAYNVPAYPASHGCVRVAIPVMDWIWDEDLAPIGMTVWVHGEIPAT
jgi:peptidoglycan hydrolase-like protein with peptidoglycan-binding domain